MIGLTFNAMRQAAATDAQIASRVRQYIIGTPLAFYDLSVDPDQRKNVIEAPEYRNEVSRMKALLLTYMEKTADPQEDNFKTLLQGGKPVVSQAPRKRLDAS